MHESKLVRYLSSFSSEEVLSFRLFYKSPFFNDGKRPLKIQGFLDRLMDYYPAFNSPELQEETIFSAVFPDEVFKKSKLDNIASESVKIVKKFIAFGNLSLSATPEFDYQLNQARFFRAKNLEGDFFGAIENAQALLDKMSFKEQSFFINAFQLESELITHYFNSNDKKSDANVPKAIRWLDLFYIVTKLEYCSYVLTLNISTPLNTSRSLLLLDEVLKAAEMHFLDIPIVAAYYYAYSLLLNKGHGKREAYQTLKKLLAEKEGHISKGTLLTIHTCMRNYLADSYNKGDKESLTELFELFKEQIRFGTIYPDGHHILASTLQNAITVALKLNETE